MTNATLAGKLDNVDPATVGQADINDDDIMRQHETCETIDAVPRRSYQSRSGVSGYSYGQILMRNRIIFYDDDI